MKHGPLVISLIALVLSVYAAGGVAWLRLAPAPVSVSVLTREWGQGVTRVLIDMDKRLMALEREVFLHGDERKP
jgi:hypothetical protein